MQEIGDALGVSRERVRQVVYGVQNFEQLVRMVRRLANLNPRDYEYVLEAARAARGEKPE